MPSQILTVTLQAALFSALSTTLAQSLTAYQTHTSNTYNNTSLKSPSSNTTIPPSPSSPHTNTQPTLLTTLLSTLDPLALLTFMAIAMIMTPPNYLYQRFLEDSFPSKVKVNVNVPGKSTKDNKAVETERLSKSNTLAKFILDQSLGAMANTAGFIILAGLAKGRGVNQVFNGDLQRDFLPMLTASWRVWPTVTLLNLIVVPFDYRMIVGNLVGVCWGVYVTMQAM